MFGNLEGVLTPINDLKLVPKWIPNVVVTGTCKSAQLVLKSKLTFYSHSKNILSRFLRDRLLDKLLDVSHLRPGFRELLGGGL